MIHANELMLGNFVEYATGLHGDKRSIPMQVTGIFSDTVYLNFDGNEGDVFEEDEENLLGIPITVELLEKCGFKRRKFFFYGPENIELGMSGSNVLLDFIGDDTWKIKDIHFLHELQNAYYLLTKKHLEVCL